MWHLLEFNEFNSKLKIRNTFPSGLVKSKRDNIWKGYSFYTKYLEIWKRLENQWYVPIEHKWFKRKKVVPKHIRLTPLVLCVWHMDDGYCNPQDANIELNTQGFTHEDVEFLIERLKLDLGIQSKIKKDRGKNKIFIGRKYYFDFINMIRPHVEWNCFQYKLDTTTYDKIAQIGEHHSQSKLTENQINEIFRLRDRGLQQKEIAKIIKTSKPNVSFILGGKRWSHLGKKREYIKKPRITQQQKEEITNLSEMGLQQKEIANKIGCNQSTVSRILK